MANESSAYGSMELIGKWSKKEITILTRLIHSLSYGCYTTELASNDYKEALKDLLETKSVGFSGNGRWAFQCNLEYMNRWLVNTSEIHYNEFIEAHQHQDWNETYEQYQKNRQWILTQMQKKQLKILWEFVDFEPGCGVLYSQIGEHEAELNPETNELEFVYKEISTENYPCNLKHYVSIYCEGDTEAVNDTVYDILKLYNKEDKFFKDVHDVITNHPNYFDLGVWTYYEKKTDIPIELRRKLLQLFKTEVKV